MCEKSLRGALTRSRGTGLENTPYRRGSRQIYALTWMRRTLVGTEDVSARVLIINEDEWVVESIRNEGMGTTIAVVHVARSGHDAIYFLESDGADVIVSRHPLPDWSLLDFVREIMQRWSDSRVIASGKRSSSTPRTHASWRPRLGGGGRNRRAEGRDSASREPLIGSDPMTGGAVVEYRAPKTDAPGMRSAIFILAGALLLTIAAFLYGFAFLDGAMQQPAFRVVVTGTLIGAFLGLLVAAITRPSGTRRTPLILLGAFGGVLAGLVYGWISLIMDGCERSSDIECAGWVFLGSWFRYPWMPIALWTVFGGVVGAFLGWTAARLARGGQSSLPAGAEPR